MNNPIIVTNVTVAKIPENVFIPRCANTTEIISPTRKIMNANICPDRLCFN